MHQVEIAYSLVSLLSAFCIIFQWRHRFGVLLGLVMQTAWIHYWFLTGQEGILILDGGILVCCLFKYTAYWKQGSSLPSLASTPPSCDSLRAGCGDGSVLLNSVITIPVGVPTKLVQCGTVSKVYPPEYTRMIGGAGLIHGDGRPVNP